MSYMRDRDVMVRGVGAIAAADARSPGRAAARRARASVMRKIDARRAMLAHGPGRKLPVAMGAIKAASTGRLQSMLAPTIKSGGVLEAPPNGPYGRPPQVQPLPPMPKPPGVKTPPLPPFTKPPRSFPANAAGLPMATVALPGSNSTPVTGVGTGSGTVIVDPVPGAGSASTGSGGGGGGGGGEWTFPSDDEPELTPPDTTVEEPPPVASSSNTGRNLLLLGAGIGLLYLLTRDHD